MEPVLNPPEKLAASRAISRLVPEEERQRCVSDVDVVAKARTARTKPQKVSSVATDLASRGLRVVTADKEGCFVIMPDGMFGTKASEAIEKNFRKIEVKPSKTKQHAIRLLQSLNLESLSSSVKRAKGLHLEVFFSCKTHKQGDPFRAIVTERNTWQQQVACFLQKQLSTLKICDPLGIPNSEVVLSYLREENPGGCGAFSIDVQDLYYSIPHAELMKSVKMCICDDNDEVKFRNHSGTSVENFLEILSLYLKSTFIGWEGAMYVQNSGVCIGSKVAPILSDIFLARVDRNIHSGLLGMVKKVFRFVDDYLVI